MLRSLTRSGVGTLAAGGEHRLTDGRTRRAGTARERWAMVLGASSGFGRQRPRPGRAPASASSASTWTCAARSRAADAVRDEIAAMGVPVVFHNVNAADEEKRPRRHRGHQGALRGAARGRARTRSSPCCCTRWRSGRRCPTSQPRPSSSELTQKQLEMTVDVMAHSLVYWVRDLFHAGPASATAAASSR